MKIDTLLTAGGLSVSLEPDEVEAYATIDSTQTLDEVFKPEGFLARLLIRNGGNRRKRDPQNREPTVSPRPILHYNRVEGTRLGASLGASWEPSGIHTEIGFSYATEPGVWNFGSRFRKGWDRIALSAEYYDGIDVRYASDLYSQFSASTLPLVGKDDYFDYLDTRRMRAGLEFRTSVPDLSLRLQFSDERHRSIVKSTDFSFFRDKIQRPNPRIDRGRLRSIGIRLAYDASRGPPALFGQRKVWAQIEHALGDTFSSDFDFTPPGVSPPFTAAG